MADHEATYRKIIQEAFEKRHKRNPRYSQNAFAKSLGLSSAYFSKLMAGKILLSLEAGEKITKIMRLNDSDRKDFLLSIAEEQRCHALYQIDPTLTDCDPMLAASNTLPRSRKKS